MPSNSVGKMALLIGITHLWKSKIESSVKPLNPCNAATIGNQTVTKRKTEASDMCSQLGA